MKFKSFVIVVLASLIVFTVAHKSVRADEPGVPGALIMEYIEKGLEILKDPELTGKDKLPERKEKLWQEISPIFNFNEMCKRALGKYWKELEDAKRTNFTELFTEVLKEGYIGKTDSYASEKIVYNREISDAKRSKVQTTLITKGNQEVSVHFRLFNNNGKWEIYDIIIEGVSLVSNYRSQFNNFLIKKSFDDLIVFMQKKVSKG